MREWGYEPPSKEKRWYALQTETNTHGEGERKQAFEIGSWTGQYCNTRVASRQYSAGIRPIYRPLQSLYPFSLPFHPYITPTINSPIPDQAYAPPSCHSIYQFILLWPFSSVSIHPSSRVAFPFIVVHPCSSTLASTSSQANSFYPLSSFSALSASVFVGCKSGYPRGSWSIQFLFAAYSEHYRGDKRQSRPMGYWRVHRPFD